MNNTRILFWNCQGVTRKRLELLQLVQQQNIDVILLNETHLSTNRHFKLPNYFSYYTNKPQTTNKPPAGGTAILVHRRIIHHQIKIDTHSLTNTTVHINSGNTELRLSAVYKSPKTILQTADIHLLLATLTNTIIAGDLNAKHTAWNSRVINTSGRLLADYLVTTIDTTVAAPTSPTHYPINPNHRPDVLDITIMKTGRIPYHLENLSSELSSDHSPLILDLFHQTALIVPPKPLHSANWSTFETQINDTKLNIPNVNSKTEIDSSIQTLIQTILDLITANTTTHPPTDNKQSLPTHITKAISLRRRLRSLW